MSYVSVVFHEVMRRLVAKAGVALLQWIDLRYAESIAPFSHKNCYLTRHSIMNTCLYYQAHVDKQRCWFFVAVLRSFEHMSFDRTLDKESSLFEIFVPQPAQEMFEVLMRDLYAQDIVIDWQPLPNRLAQPGAEL